MSTYANTTTWLIHKAPVNPTVRRELRETLDSIRNLPEASS